MAGAGQRAKPKQKQHHSKAASSSSAAGRSHHGGNSAAKQLLNRSKIDVPAPCIGLDLGGSLTKICYFEPFDTVDVDDDALSVSQEEETTTVRRDDRLAFESQQFQGKFRFLYFHTSQTREAIQVIHTLAHSRTAGSAIHATGGGAIKFAKFIKQELGVQLVAEDELETVVRGIVFTLLEHPQTCYTLDSSTAEFERRPAQHETLDGLFPLLVVNIGSGVSIIKVDSPDSMRRVSGTAVGGGTFYGLCKLLTRCETFDEAMNMASSGDANAVNMLVSDIYGGGYERVGLLGTITASFFGKAAAGGYLHRARPASSGSHEDVLTAQRERSQGAWFSLLRATAPYHFALAVVCCFALEALEASTAARLSFAFGVLAVTAAFAWYLTVRRREFRRTFKTSKEDVFRDEDIARALVQMIAQNVTQIAYLNAKMHHTKRIVFTGNFLRHNAIALRTLTSNLALFSGGEIEALFTEHEGFFGALGAFLMSAPAKHRLDECSNNGGGGGGAPPPRSSFHAPEEGDDGYHLSSPQVTPRLPPRVPAVKSLDGFTI